MAEFQPFNLGQVFATAEGIKAARAQATSDRLREQYLGLQIKGMEQDQASKKRIEEVTLGKEKAQQVYTTMQYALQSQNPKNFLESQVPDLVKNLQSNGVDWATVDDGRAKQMIQGIMAKAGAEIGVGPGNLTEREKIELQSNLANTQRLQGQDFQREMQDERLAANAQQGELNRDARVSAAGAKQTQQALMSEQRLRKEFRALPSVKSYEAALPIVETAKNAPDTPAGDLQVVYSVGKALDPDSVVREGELQLTQNATPFLQKVIGRARAEMRGKGRLTPKTRADLVDMLGQRIAGYKAAYDRDYQQYAKYAEDSGFAAERIVGSEASSAFKADDPLGIR